MTKYNIHPDFNMLKIVKLSMRPAFIALVNGIMRTSLKVAKLEKSTPEIERKTEVLQAQDSGSCKIHILRPRNLPDYAPVILYLHGGAFALTYTSMHQINLEKYATETQSLAVLVDYRLTPKYPFPAGFNDCFAALEYIHKHAELLNIDPKRILVMGDSAGGALVAGLAQKARDKQISICGQLMIYPVLDHRCITHSVKTFTDAPVWNGKNTIDMWKLYLKGHDVVPPYASPASMENLTGLVKSYIETAEFDPLRDEALDYAKALESADVDVTLNETKGTVHGYDAIAKSKISKAAIKARMNFIKACFEEKSGRSG